MTKAEAQPQLLLRAKYKKDSKRYSLPRSSSLTDLRRTLSEGFKIPEEEVKISTTKNYASSKPLIADGATLICDIFRNRDQMLVERKQKISDDLQTLMGRLKKQQTEYDSKIRRWQDGEDGVFCVASFADWKLNPGCWGFEIVNFLWPDDTEIEKEISHYKRKRARGRVLQSLRNEVMFEIKVFEALQSKYRKATVVTEIMTCYLQLSASMDFQSCNGIARLIAGFCGTEEYLNTLPEDEVMMATFWSNVCANPALEDKTYNSSNAELLAESLTQMCVVDTDSELKISELAFALRKKFSEDSPTCFTWEDLFKSVDSLKEWDKAILQWFVDHKFVESLESTSDSFWLTRNNPTCNLRLLEEVEAEEEQT
jgi:hypothetical protein